MWKLLYIEHELPGAHKVVLIVSLSSHARLSITLPVSLALSDDSYGLLLAPRAPL